MDRIAIIAPLPPLKTGIAIYSHKLYSRVAEHIPILILSDYRSKQVIPGAKILRCWDKDTFISSLITITRCLKLCKPRLIHLQLGFTLIKNYFITMLFAIYLLLLSRILKYKIVITLHGIMARESIFFYLRIFNKSRLPITPVYLLFKIYYIIISKLADLIILHNHSMARKFIEMTNCALAKIRVIPHGVDVRKERVMQKKFCKEGKIILFTGFIRRSKGIHSLILAFGRFLKKNHNFRNVKLLIAGPKHFGDDDEYLTFLKLLVKKLGIERNVKILCAFLSEEELDELIANSDVIVLPYIDYFYEASGVLARIMSFGKPVICTRIPKFEAEIEDGVSGILINPLNVSELEKALRLVIGDNVIRRQLGENLKKKTINRSWDDVAKRHIKLYVTLSKHIPRVHY